MNSKRFLELLAKREAEAGKRFKRKDIVEATGVRPQTITELFKGNTHVLDNAKGSTLRALAEFLECTVDDLLVRREEEQLV